MPNVGAKSIKVPIALKPRGIYVLTAALLAGPSRVDINRVNRPRSRQAFLGGFPCLQAAVGPTLGLPLAACRAKVWDRAALSRLSQTQPLPEATGPACSTPGFPSRAEEPC